MAVPQVRNRTPNPKNVARVDESSSQCRGFSLIEVLMVCAITGLLMVVCIPALGAIQNATALADSAGKVAMLLEQARGYALANNTSVYFAFNEFDGNEENGTTKGTGRIAIAAFAVKGGRSSYSDPLSELVPITKVVQLRGVSIDPTIPTSGRLARRNADSLVGASSFPDLAKPIPSGKWLFPQALRFDPMGSTWASSDPSVRDTFEIGLRPARGNIADAKTPNVAALQVDALTGAVTLYRP